MSVAAPAFPAVETLAAPRPSPAARRLAGFGPPALAALITGLVVVLGLQMTRAELAFPFIYHTDFFLTFPIAQEVMERGPSGAWTNPRMGFPGVQEWYDFPVTDALHFAGLWALHKLGLTPLAAYNLYFLLGYPLAAATGAWGAGRLGASAPAATTAGVLFSLLPYHQGRDFAHYFLSAYFTVPVACVWAVRCAQGRGWGWLPAVAAGLLTAWAGAYYAFFACVLLATAAVHAAAAGGWRASRFGLGAVLIVAAGGVAVQLPVMAYHAEYGPNDRVTTRRAWDGEQHGLRLAYLALPHDRHRSGRLAEARWHYDVGRREFGSENNGNGLGLVPAAGLAVAMLAGLFPGRWAGRLTVPGRLALGLVLVCSAGGVSSLVFEFAFTQIRAYNRAAVFLGFFGAAAGALAVDRVGPRWRWPAAVLLTGFGVWDQTPRDWFSPDAKMARRVSAARYRIDGAFYSQLEAEHPGAVVFGLPFVSWPEDSYGHVPPVLHTTSWKFGFGAVRNREVDEWQRKTAARPLPEAVQRMVLRGFDAIIADPRLIDLHHPGPTADELRAVLGPDRRERVHPDGATVYFDLRPFRDRLRAEIGATEFERRVRAEAEAVQVAYLNGFTSFTQPGKEDTGRWLYRRGQMVLVNPTDRVRRVRVAFTAGTARTGGVVGLTAGGAWTGEWPGLRAGDPVAAEFDLPPGRHTIRLTARPDRPPVGVFPDAPAHAANPDVVLELRDLSVTALE